MSAGNLTKIFCDEGLKTVEGDASLARDLAPKGEVKIQYGALAR